MPRALWNGHVVAEAERFEEVEGNIYFPPDALNRELARPSALTTVCGWKGTARYLDLIDGDQVAPNAVWTYPDPSRQPPTSKTTSPFIARPCGSRCRRRSRRGVASGTTVRACATRSTTITATAG